MDPDVAHPRHQSNQTVGNGGPFTLATFLVKVVLEKPRITPKKDPRAPTRVTGTRPCQSYASGADGFHRGHA